MNYELTAKVLLLLPLFSALTILLLHKLLREASVYVSLGSAIICLICSVRLLLSPPSGDSMEGMLLPFLNLPGLKADFGYILDKQAIGMMFIVTFIGFLVHLYSTAYMKEDDARPRFFGALSLFMFSMTGIVLSSHFVMMFVFWELVGLSSYLLIGHWFKKPEAADAANKAFMTNRIGDFGFMIGILCVWALSFVGTISDKPTTTHALAAPEQLLATKMANSPTAVTTEGADYTGDIRFSTLATTYPKSSSSSIPGWLLTLAALGIFMGAVGKSAQVPLHVWLPDAMEGPTPVSALIHAATMVAAGVYMLVRAQVVIAASPLAMDVIAWTGGITALLAALMAVQQNDIKRILAYSTLSQLGYMVMSVGLHAGEAGMFHLYTHAFFKALLFLGAGAVIYACHHEQDIWKMGGLKDKTPMTFVTFAIGTLALMGMPFMSGFFSKEEILLAAKHECWGLLTIGVITAFLTSFYMTRCVVVTFFGKARGEGANHAHEAPMVMLVPLMLLAAFSILSGYGPVAEKLKALKPHGPHGDGAGLVMGLSIGVFVLGALAGLKLYWGKDKDPLNIPLFANRFYIDQIYAMIVKIFQDRLAWIVTAMDTIFADGLAARLPTAVACRVGRTARSLQSGQLQGYGFVFGAGLILAIYLMTR
ncbi:MAG: NADH-quinone oxidoreductase subunit L [Verrucomicrobiaceae bacterium]|nr:NADH-quinone oxidoreductase subunit L [Verrucomicrobiaceae bacterium]